ncbi:MAG: TonB-dependent receptor [Bernardetiaceae bacterium]|nr:TonB-dependent receptor [Bernardetiaceae bacterium]
MHVVDEEGLGMRVNIGIRGLDPSRSTSVLVLEDGIPVALNPYGEPEMYYTPAMDRMAGVEVLKGSGQVLFGPQTIGGVVNYITAAPPEEARGYVRVRGGEGSYFSTHIGYGNTVGKAGYQVDFLRKQGDNIGPTQFRINDLNAKVRFALSDKSSLGFKIGVYDEVSNSTYVGLTQSMYDAGGAFDFVQIAPNDELEVRRYSLSATHLTRFNSNIKLQTTAFGYTTTRNWRRQDFSYDPNASNQTGVIWGDESIPGGAIYMRNSTGNRNRQFEVAGLESKLTAFYNLGNIENELNFGARLMYERAFEQRVNGSSADARSGLLRDDEIRTGYGTSFYLQNQFMLTSKFSVTAGARTEIFDYERNILRQNSNDTSIVANSSTIAIIPGAGVNYTLKENTSIFAGLHRGFAPPRVKDAIANDGEVYELEAELSWNAEIGMRTQFAKGVSAEFTAFYMNFSNQVIPVAEAAGGLGAGFLNGGATLHQGVEFAIAADFAQILGYDDYVLAFDVNATFTDAKFSEDRFIGGEDGTNVNGNFTPYAPRTMLSSAITAEVPFGLGFRLTGTYVGEQFTDPINTIEAAPNGRIGKLDDYLVLDATVSYQFKFGVGVNIAVKNITDARYIATRRPQGIRVGLPRLFTAGLNWDF